MRTMVIKNRPFNDTESVWKHRRESRELQKQRTLEVRRLLKEMQEKKTKQIISEMFQR
jgi:hypothetical protein